MPDAIHVRPGRWANSTVLYDDGSYSVIWDNQPTQPRLGVRWNGDAGRPGYPNLGGNSLWYVEPPVFTPAILYQCYAAAAALPPSPERTLRLADIAAALIAAALIAAAG